MLNAHNVKEISQKIKYLHILKHILNKIFLTQTLRNQQAKMARSDYIYKTKFYQ